MNREKAKASGEQEFDKTSAEELHADEAHTKLASLQLRIFTLSYTYISLTPTR